MEPEFTLAELRATLANTIRQVATGAVPPAVANAQANLTGKVLSSYKLQIDYHKMFGKTVNLPFLEEQA
jgi:hypothetical protein